MITRNPRSAAFRAKSAVASGFDEQIGRALHSHAEIIERFHRVAHRFPVRFAAHDNSDNRVSLSHVNRKANSFPTGF